MSIETILRLINLVLALFTLAMILRFWWLHHQAGISRGWRILIIALGLLAISEASEAAIFLRPNLPITSLGTSVRFLYMAVLLMALSYLFADVLASQKLSLDDAQKTIKLQEERVRKAQEHELLTRITENLIASLDLETILNELCRQTRELIQADSVSVRLPEPTKHGFRFAVDFASALKIQPEHLYPKIDTLAWKVVQAGRPAVIEDAKEHELFSPHSPEWLGALAAFPLLSGNDVIGVLTTVFDKKRIFDKSEIKLLSELANHAAIAVHNGQLHEEVELRASTDVLTGLANRRYFNELLSIEYRRAQRYDLPLAIILADIDNLKSVNDTYGHPAGDAALITFARTLQENVRTTDIPSRYGGDEFTIILPETGREEARTLVNRIYKASEDLAIDWEGNTIPIRFSLGVAGFKGKKYDIADLLKAADDMLYEVKATKR